MAVAVLASLITGLAGSSPAKAQGTSAVNCRIDRQQPAANQPVSVAFPVHPDRLAGRTKVNVLVARFELTDVPYRGDPATYQRRDQNTAALVDRLSRGTVSLNFTYAPEIYKHRRTLAEWEAMKANQHRSYGAGDEANSTWGFVREAIRDLDPSVDFTGIDSVVLQGPFDRRVASEQTTSIYEAMMTRSEASGFFRSFASTEQQINNAFVMSGTMDWLVYAHELLHNFGLADLYDSTGTVPPQELQGWSLFASQQASLYYWERWQLGWISDSEVICFDLRTGSRLTPQDITLAFNSATTPKMAVIRTHATRAIVIELREPMTAADYPDMPSNQRTLSGQALVTYSVHSDRWPGPIRLLNQPQQVAQDDFSVGVTRAFEGFEAHVIDAEPGRTRIGLWSADQASTSSAAALKAAAMATMDQRRIAEQARLKAEADARAKAEAEARAKAQAEAAAAQAPKPAASSKRTLTCIKGKQIKKVRTVTPKCPAGWKRR